MHEDFLHLIWKTNKLIGQQLFTSKNEKITIKHQGVHNQLAGPDFFNAQVKIEGQLWAGNVEMHLKSSDWFAHGHEKDPNYDNVVLHVVWEDDVAVFRRDGSEIPTLKVKDYLAQEVLESYQGLLENSKRKFINCENDFAAIGKFHLDNWLDRLYIERLEKKAIQVDKLLEQYRNDWEKVLFCLLMKNFGSKVNGAFFLDIARTIDFSVIRKVHDKPMQLEALLMGTARLLEEKTTDAYHTLLRKEHEFLKNKFQINAVMSGRPSFFGMRPHNFPTIRLAQIAQLYHKSQNLFSLLLAAKKSDELKYIFDVSTSVYWDEHYTFGKASKKKRKKKLTPRFVELVVINTILPLKFCHARHEGKDINDELIGLISDLKAESNSIVKRFDTIGPKTVNALQSQSKIQLYSEYCSKNLCLRCAVGTNLLKGNT